MRILNLNKNSLVNGLITLTKKNITIDDYKVYLKKSAEIISCLIGGNQRLTDQAIYDSVEFLDGYAKYFTDEIQ